MLFVLGLICIYTGILYGTQGDGVMATLSVTAAVLLFLANLAKGKR